MSDCSCEDIIIKISEEGIDGNGIVGIELISTVGLVKTYRITMTNGMTFDYEVADGSSIASISKTATDVLTDTYTITLTNSNTTTFQVTNGRGIVSVVKTGTDVLKDTYTITFNDGTTSAFEVMNGKGITSIYKTGTSILTDTYTVLFNDGSTTTFEVVNGRGITKITYQSSSGLVDTYKITYNDGTTSTFTVTNGMPCTHSWNGTTLTITSASGTSSANLKGEKGDAATIAVGTVTTGAEGTNAIVTNVGTSKDARFNFTIPRGNTGNGISSITLLSQSGLVKTYRITYTNGTHFDFSVSDGNGIASIEKTATVGAVDTYTVTFTDPTAEPFEYTVTNGSDEWGAIVGDIADQTDLQTALDNKAPVIVESTSGDIVTITDGADDMPVESLSVSVDAVQDLHGYENPWPAGGGKNLLPTISQTQTINGVTWTLNPDGSVKISGTATGNSNCDFGRNVLTLPAGSYTTLDISVTGVIAVVVFGIVSGTATVIKNGGGAFTLEEATSVFVRYSVPSGITANNTTIYPQIELGSTPTAYAPYENICPISGHTSATVYRYGANLYDNTKELYAGYIDGSDGSVRGTSGSIKHTDYILIPANVDITVCFGDALSSSVSLAFYNNDKVFISSESIRYKQVINVTTPVNAVYMRSSISPETQTYLSIRVGTFTTAENPPYQSTQVTIPLGQTVYGATLDVGAGTLSVTHVKHDLTDPSKWIEPTASRINCDVVYNEQFTDRIVYSNSYEGLTCSAMRIAVTGDYIRGRWYQADSSIFGVKNITLAEVRALASDISIIYELATPTVITGLTPAILRTLLGYNNIWADAGAVDVRYRADSKLYVDGQISEAVTAVKRIMTTTTDTMTAPKNLTAGQIVIVGDDLYKATSNIASGATLTVGSNVVKVTLAEWIASLVA